MKTYSIYYCRSPFRQDAFQEIIDMLENCLPATSTMAQQQFNRLERWLGSPEVNRLGLLELERGTELRGRELLRLLLQAHVQGRGDGDVGAALKVFEPGRRDEPLLYTHKRIHVRSVLTIFGEISVSRLGYRMPGKPSLHPLDEHLQLPLGTYSYEIQRRLVKQAVQGPFDVRHRNIDRPASLAVLIQRLERGWRGEGSRFGSKCALPLLPGDSCEVR